MADPVIVCSGLTFERYCVLACPSLSFKPPNLLATDDFTTIIPNLALKSTIINWCKTNSFSSIPQSLIFFINPVEEDDQIICKPRSGLMSDQDHSRFLEENNTNESGCSDPDLNCYLNTKGNDLKPRWWGRYVVVRSEEAGLKQK